MTDKISGFSTAEPLAPVKGSNGNAVVSEKPQGESTSTGTGSTSQTGDHVTLTDSARALQRIEEAVAKSPVVNAEKVFAVKQAVGSGSYRIDAARVADKLLKFERGLK